MLTPFKYVLRSLLHFRKQHVVLLLATAISAMVLTGALIIGDSIDYSLLKMMKTRLGKTRFAVVGGNRFVRDSLAAELSSGSEIKAAPLLMLKGIAINSESGNRINKATVIGIDSSFSFFANSPLPVISGEEALISENIAGKLQLKVNDEFLIRVESTGILPVNTPFAGEVKPSVALRLTVKAIAGDDELGRLNLYNDQSEPYNIFVSLGFLSDRAGLEGRANTILIADPGNRLNVDSINRSIKDKWKIADMSLDIKRRDSSGVYDLVSDRVFIDKVVSETIRKAGIPHQDILTYLVNSIRFNGRQTPYSFVSALPSSLTGFAPDSNEVIVNRWLSDDLNIHEGDTLTASYFDIGPLRELKETARRFVVKAIIPTASNGIDNSLMPMFPGLADAGNCSEWDAGVPMDFNSIRNKDEKYWDDFRGAPKMLVQPETGVRLWGNQFGELTSIRFNEKEIPSKNLEKLITSETGPEEIGLQIIDSAGQGKIAAGNSVDFSGLFLGLSFFIIAAGIMLVTLMYVLHLQTRSDETALLNGLGFTHNDILKIRLAESAFVIVAGSLLGAVAGIAYNFAVMNALNSVWNDMIRTNMLDVYVKLLTILVGACSNIIIALIPVYLITKRKLREPVATLIKGKGIIGANLQVKKLRTKRNISVAALACSVLLVMIALITDSFENAFLYLSAAALFLTGSIFLFNYLLTSPGNSKIDTLPGIGTIAFRNLTRNKARSTTVVTVLALGTFTLILTGANRRTFYGSENLRNSGTGGYLLWVETTSPLPFNLNRDNGRSYLNTNEESDLDGVRFLQFVGLEGDDASCLNLNQAQKPRILAVDPHEFDSCGSFSFTRLLPGISKEHPWKELEKQYSENVFPVFADQSVIQYGLKKKIGDTLQYVSEEGKVLKLVLAGGISNSIFQGNILIDENVFREQYPSSGGSKVMLVDAPVEKRELLSSILEQSLMDFGVDVSPTSQRLATFNTIENTYLSVFMALSGFGFLIGTIGLGIVLLRNISERKRELAVLLSAGYSHKQLFSMVFAENLILLFSGLMIGILAALTGIMPSLLTPSFSIRYGFLTMLITAILFSGIAWIYFPLRSALNKPLMPSLRND